MIAVKIKGFDLKEGQEFKFFFVVDPNSGDFRQLASERVNVNDKDPDINELRFKSGFKDIYCIVDMKSWGNYWDHRHQLIELNAKLADDPSVLRSLANYEKEQKAFRIWQAAKEYEV